MEDLTTRSHPKLGPRTLLFLNLHSVVCLLVVLCFACSKRIIEKNGMVININIGISILLRHVCSIPEQVLAINGRLKDFQFICTTDMVLNFYAAQLLVQWLVVRSNHIYREQETRQTSKTSGLCVIIAYALGTVPVALWWFTTGPKNFESTSCWDIELQIGGLYPIILALTAAVVLNVYFLGKTILTNGSQHDNGVPDSRVQYYKIMKEFLKALPFTGVDCFLDILSVTYNLPHGLQSCYHFVKNVEGLLFCFYLTWTE